MDLDASRETEAGLAETLERARACYAGRAWADAFALLSQADAREPLAGEPLELLCWSATLSGHDEEMVAALERLYQLHLDTGEDLPAARVAFLLGFCLFGMGEPGRAGGWLARAQRLVEGAGRACAEQGYLMLPLAAQHLGAGDYAAAESAAAAAVQIGEGFAEPDLVAFAQNLQGRVLLRQGRVADGLILLDEAMLAATAGELSPLFTGLVYCSVIATCQQSLALDRAREWTTALAAWCAEQPQLMAFSGACRVHRAEIMQICGAWPQALEEARSACRRLSESADRGPLADAHYQQAEVHRLRGEWAAAERAYRQASGFGREPQPGLALLRLAQERRDDAVCAIRRMLDTTTAAWQRAHYLPAGVEIALAAGDLDGARSAALELEQIAERFKLEVLAAMAAHARGAVLLADGDARGAVAPLRHAFQLWQKAAAPYIAARIRVLLGRAYHSLGDAEGGRLELEAARQVFEQLGAAPALAALDEAETGAAPASDYGLTRRERQVLRLAAGGETSKAIACALSVSERTIDRHLSNIFTKLDVNSRTAAAAFAYRHGLL